MTKIVANIKELSLNLFGRQQASHFRNRAVIIFTSQALFKKKKISRDTWTKMASMTNSSTAGQQDLLAECFNDVQLHAIQGARLQAVTEMIFSFDITVHID